MKALHQFITGHGHFATKYEHTDYSLIIIISNVRVCGTLLTLRTEFLIM